MYKTSCKNCRNNNKSYFYIGEISRPVRERFKKHLSDARLRRLGTGLGGHILDSHTTLSHNGINSNFHIEILSRNRDVADSEIDESVKIRENTPNLNTYLCSVLAYCMNVILNTPDSHNFDFACL